MRKRQRQRQKQRQRQTERERSMDGGERITKIEKERKTDKYTGGQINGNIACSKKKEK